MHSSFSWFLSFSINFEIFIVKFVKNKKQSPFVLLRNIPGYLYQVFNLFNFWWIFVLFPVIVIQSPNHIRLCNPMDCRMPDLPVPHHLLKFAQVYLHFISDAIQPSHPLVLSSPVLSLSQYLELFQWVSCSQQMTKILEFQLQHQSFQWVFRIDFP